MYREYKNLDLPQIAEEVLTYWKEHRIFEKSIETREGKPTYTFFEGPPSANGLPGIHHVLGRTIKDIFCRYKTLKGFQVKRKSGWDTHGLPIELQVENRLGIKKEDIGHAISVEDYNAECKKDVMQYKGIWEDLTEKIGFWLDLQNPYVTYNQDYIETVWFLLKQLFDKDLLYKGYSIQPYSPAAGTGLSSHELNQPGTYKAVKDVSCTAQFKLKNSDNEFLLAWTTTPWTLPSNTALAVGKNITYILVQTFNPYTLLEVKVYLAKDLLSNYFNPKGAEIEMVAPELNAKILPYRVIKEIKGSDLVGMQYEQLMPFVQVAEGAFKVIEGDFVSTEDGTGIVHIAPTFGADDQRVALQQNIPPVMVADPDTKESQIPLVDKKGKFVSEMGIYAGRYVKNYTDSPDYQDVNIDISVQLKKENKAFRVEKYEHNYPHCWRTDKPILYYPLESWFIKTTAYKDRLIELNNQINWKPASTGTGRFGNWLQNLVDWNVSRSRYWGTPLPIWQTVDGSESKCIGSIAELIEEVENSVAQGFMEKPISDNIDLHRPFVDDLVLASNSGKPMHRVTDVVDVWFDSGAMPYAQWHYPFENNEVFDKNFPADFIAEGVDQTRGWFFTLHTIATMLFDKVAFKNVIANGLVLDKNGNKMSKRLGNGIDPFTTMNSFGIDALRWYMVHNAQPWDNLKFDLEGVESVRNKFFGTLHNTYQFFALYANIDKFKFEEPAIPLKDRPEIDRWILSLLNSLILKVDEALDAYEPTKAIRLINDFVIDQLSNWYVRLCRRRFWKGEYSTDKISAYQTLFSCLDSVARIGAIFSPFYLDRLYLDLNAHRESATAESVHLTDFPKVDTQAIDYELERSMAFAQKISSIGLGIRKAEKIRVRQPLQKILLPVSDAETKQQIERIIPLVMSELNVKEVSFISDTTGILVKKVKPNFKLLGPKLGKNIKFLQAELDKLSQQEIAQFEKSGVFSMLVNGVELKLLAEEVNFINQDIEGWKVSGDEEIVVALDIQIDDDLRNEGIARELVNRIQNIRKDDGFEVSDKILIELENSEEILAAVAQFKNYICSETLAIDLQLLPNLDQNAQVVAINDIDIHIRILKA